MKSTIDHEEIEKFSRLSPDQWENSDGSSPNAAMMLHQINILRLKYIISHWLSGSAIAVKDLEVLDIGCGGGLVSLPLARLGAAVLGIDASEACIKAAQAISTQSQEAGLSNLPLNLRYETTTAEALCCLPQHQSNYDVITALEIIEHINDLPLFLDSCWAMLKPQGLLYISSINRTLTSYIEAIVIAEHLLHLLPRGTHNWHKFQPPSAIIQTLEQNSHKYRLLSIKGLQYNLMKSLRHTLSSTLAQVTSGEFISNFKNINNFKKDNLTSPIKVLHSDAWELVDQDVSVNYIMCIQKI